MKNRIIFLLLVIIIMPIIINAEQCKQDDILINNIELNEKSDSVDENIIPEIVGSKIIINAKMSNVGDYALYKLSLKNESNNKYEIDNNIISTSDYIDYTVYTEDDSKYIESNETKTIYLRIEYKNELDNSLFQNGVYNDNNTVVVNLSSNNNPKTGAVLYSLLFILILVVFVTLLTIRFNLLKTKDKVFIFIVIVGTSILNVKAICKYSFEVESSIEIVSPRTVCLYNDSTFEFGLDTAEFYYYPISEDETFATLLEKYPNIYELFELVKDSSFGSGTVCFGNNIQTVYYDDDESWPRYRFEKIENFSLDSEVADKNETCYYMRYYECQW